MVLIALSIAILSAVLIEALLFNVSSYLPKLLGLKTAAVAAADVKSYDGFVYNEEEKTLYTIKNRSTLDFTVPEEGASYIKLDGDGSKFLNNVTVFHNGIEKSQHFFTADEPQTMIFSIHAKPGEVVSLHFERDFGLKIRSIVVNEGRAFNFDFLRFGIIALILCGIAVIIVFKVEFFGKDYDNTNKFHNRAFFILMAFLLCVVALVAQIGGSIGEKFSFAYPFQQEFRSYGAYMQQTDAFIKGQLHLDIEIPEEVLKVENPYNPNNMRDEWMGLLWDKAFYNGKAYSYFGVVPIILVYLPFFFLTGRVPADIVFLMLASMGSIVFIMMLIREAIIQFKLKVRVLVMFLGMFAAIFGGMVFLLLASANFYTVAVAGGLVFLLGFLYFSLRAKRSLTYPQRYIYFALAALFLGFTAGSRPNMALYAVSLIPLYVSVLTEKETKLDQKLFSVASFGVVLFACAGALMIYNAARFSSPFDFGNNYQITVSEVSKNKVDFKYFTHAMYHYLLQPPTFRDSFPFMLLARNSLPDYGGRYFYLGQNIGAFFYPVTFFAYLSPLLLIFRRKLRYLVYSLITAMATVIAFLDFSLAGSHVRYTTDTTPMLALVGVLLLLEFSKKKEIKIAACVMFAATILMALPFVFDNETHVMIYTSPGLFSWFAHPILW